tara:strand:+ start:537 stop:800 length:264 start_codon:yes stop_codon:yes gene_type:complete
MDEYRLLPKSEWTVSNIRSEYSKCEFAIQEAKQIGTKSEVEHYKDRGEEILYFMTPEQQSIAMDDFDEIPKVFDKLIAIVREQEGRL